MRPSPIPFAIVAVLCLGTLLITIDVFTGTATYATIDPYLRQLTSMVGMTIGLDTLLFAIFAAIVVLSILSERRLSYSLWFAWTLFLPAAYPYSGLEWFNGITGMELPIEPVRSWMELFLMGALIVASGVLLRSHLSSKAVAKNLLGRGAEPSEVDSALLRNFGMNAIVVAVSCGTMALVAIVYDELFLDLGSLAERLSLGYVTLALLAIVAIVAIYGVQIASGSGDRCEGEEGDMENRL